MHIGAFRVLRRRMWTHGEACHVVVTPSHLTVPRAIVDENLAKVLSLKSRKFWKQKYSLYREWQGARESLCCSISGVIRWLSYDLYVLNHWYFILAKFYLLCKWDPQAPELQHGLLMSSASSPSCGEFSSFSIMGTSYWYPYTHPKIPTYRAVCTLQQSRRNKNRSFRCVLMYTGDPWTTQVWIVWVHLHLDFFQ